MFGQMWASLMDHPRHALKLMIQMALVLVSCNILTVRLLPTLQTAYWAQRMGVSNLMWTDTPAAEPLESFLACGQVLQSDSCYDPVLDQSVLCQPISQETLDSLSLPFVSQLPATPQKTQAYISSSLAQQYPLGSQLELELWGVSAQTLEVTVAGVLEGDWMPVLPFAMGMITPVERQPTSMLLVCTPESASWFQPTGIYLYLSQEGGDAALNTTGTVFTAQASLDEYLLSSRLAMRRSILMCGAILLLCIIGFSVQIYLSIHRQLRTYALYYLCGANWRSCMLIQAGSDLILVAGAVAVSCLFLSWRRALQGTTMVTSTLLLLALFGLPMTLTWRSMHRQQPIDIIRRWQEWR